MPPARLYKYQTVSARSLANIRSRTVWFAAPKSFNDPLDCGLQVIEPELSNAELDRILAHHRHTGGIAPELDEKLAAGEEVLEQARAELRKATTDAFEQAREDMLSRRGVACFSESVDEILMWSHYADGHRGFCLEFATADPPFSLARQVTYTSTIPTISVADLLEGNNGPQVREAMLLTKFHNWSYEKEWRAFNAEANESVSYNYKLLTGVYLGAAMPAAHRDVIGQLLLGSPTQLHQMAFSPRSFVVSANQASYAAFDYA